MSRKAKYNPYDDVDDHYEYDYDFEDEYYEEYYPEEETHADPTKLAALTLDDGEEVVGETKTGNHKVVTLTDSENTSLLPPPPRPKQNKQKKRSTVTGLGMVNVPEDAFIYLAGFCKIRDILLLCCTCKTLNLSLLDPIYWCIDGGERVLPVIRQMNEKGKNMLRLQEVAHLNESIGVIRRYMGESAVFSYNSGITESGSVASHCQMISRNFYAFYDEKSGAISFCNANKKSDVVYQLAPGTAVAGMQYNKKFNAMLISLNNSGIVYEEGLIGRGANSVLEFVKMKCESKSKILWRDVASNVKQYTAIKTDKNNPELMFVCEDRDSFGKMQARVYDVERGVKVYEHLLSDVKCVEFKGKCIFSLLGTGEVVINDIRGWEEGGAGRMEGKISQVGLKTNEYAPGWSYPRGAWLKFHGGRCYYSMANGPIYATQNILKRMKDAGEETTTTTTAPLSFKSQHIFEDMNPINCLVEFHGDIMVTINWDSFGTGSGIRMTKIKTYDLKEGGSRGVLSEFDVHGLSNFGNGPVKMQIDDTKIVVLFSRAVRVYDLNSHDADKTSYKGLMEALHEKWRKKEITALLKEEAERLEREAGRSTVQARDAVTYEDEESERVKRKAKEIKERQKKKKDVQRGRQGEGKARDKVRRGR
ncbi:hypothetical protein TrLO_g9344 [Triparma laevis f. longispina]|uniref:F-box domain-containing protein n=1 Tax=Triparma laevis f. longispina TaxID=1714387 RepID=A0A9W7AEQ8_9STRA|nr:hypothetical protein TrLO_g9344 [Triparma laevis f. longispina]